MSPHPTIGLSVLLAADMKCVDPHATWYEHVRAFETPEEVANAIDRQLLDNYQLYNMNYWALEKLANSGSLGHVDVWQALRSTVNLEDTSEFETRFEQCPEEHRSKFLEMYANPVVNKHRSRSSTLSAA